MLNKNSHHCSANLIRTLTNTAGLWWGHRTPAIVARDSPMDGGKWDSWWSMSTTGTQVVVARVLAMDDGGRGN